MVTYERQQKIFEYLKDKHFATMKELAQAVWTSESSIRRDIKLLEQKGVVRQIYGGVVLPEYENAVVPVTIRDGSNATLKDAIAKRAAERLFNGATVIMDGSSTVRRIVNHIDKFRDLRIITNNVRVFQECRNSTARVYCTGGLFLPQNNIFIGSAAENYINSINADILFLSSQAISEDGEISDASEEETALRRVMLTRAKKKIFLCDSSKIGMRRTFTLCNAADVDEVICDAPLPWEQKS